MKIGRLNRASFAKTARRAMFLFAFAALGTQAATVAKVNGTGYETLDEAIKAVQNGETIVVNEGEYKLNGNLTYTGKTFTIQAAEGATVSFDMLAAVTLSNAKITFSGVTFDYKTNGNYIGLQHADTLVYNDCTINGQVFLYAASETFNRCTFNQTSADSYNVWTYGAKAVTFNDCTFNCAGKSVLVYNEGSISQTELAVSDCEFKASAQAAGKAAIEIDTHLMAGGATITIDAATTAEGFDEGSNSKSTLWNDKRQTQATNTNTTVTVAGVTVFAPIVAKVGEKGYTTLAAALADVAEGKPLTWVAEGAWPVETPVYYNGTFYETGTGFAAKGALERAIDAANAANAAAVAKIYVRPGFEADELVLQAHQQLKTALAIYGNDAKLSRNWEPCVEYPGTSGDSGAHQLTKDVSLAIYNLHNGAGFWGRRTTAYTVDLKLSGCQNAHQVMFYGNANTGVKGKTNISVTNCTFDATTKADHNVIVTIGAGKVDVSDTTFTAANINVKNVDGGDNVITVKDCAFKDTVAGNQNIRVRSYVEGTHAGLTIENVTFAGASTQNVEIGDSKAECKGAVSYTITKTSGKLNVYKQGATAVETTTLDAAVAYSGDNVGTIADEKALRKAFFEAPTDGTVVTVKLGADITLETLYAAENFGTEKLDDNAAGDTFNRYKVGVHPTAENPNQWNPLVTEQTQEQRLVYGAYYHMSAGDERIARLVVKAGQKIVLDLNGHTIQKAAGATHGDWSNVCTDIIGNYGTLKIVDSSTGTKGTIKGIGYISCGGAVLHNYAGATMTVTGVNVDGNAAGMSAGTGQYVVSNEGGTLTIDGANVFDTATSASLIMSNGGTVTIKNATLSHPATKVINAKGGVINIESASVTSDAYAVFVTGDARVNVNGSLTIEGTGTLKVEGNAATLTKKPGVELSAPAGFTWVENDGVEVLKSFVAKVGETAYLTIAEACAALNAENHTLTLLNENAWDAATPVYWAAGSQSGYAATLTAALTAAYKANAGANAGAITIVCRPGADVGTMTHGHVADDLTIYGNDAFISGGECDLEVDTYKFSRATGAQAADGAYLEKDITITAYELDNLGVWGQRNTDHTVTVNLTDCDGKAPAGNVQRVYISGTTGVNNITLMDCDFLTKATAVYSNADGAIKAVNCSFTGGQAPFNINHKANGTQTVAVENCTFTRCGDADGWKQFAAPLRLVNSGAGTLSAEVKGCAFTDTIGANGDILLGDGRTGQASNDVALKVTDTAANIQAQKPGYYGGETEDETKMNTATSPAEGTLETSVAELLPVVVVVTDTVSAQAALDAATPNTTIIFKSGTYEPLFIRQTLEMSTRRSDLDKDGSYPAYLRSFKNLTLIAEEGAEVISKGITAEAGLFWHDSAPASNQVEMDRPTSGFISYLALENVTIDGIAFDSSERSAVTLRDNEAVATRGTIMVDGLTIQNCTGTGVASNKNIHFLAAGAGTNDQNFPGTEKKAFNNLVVKNCILDSYYQPIAFNNATAVLNGLTVTGNTFSNNGNSNVLQLSNKVNSGAFVIKNNLFKDLNGRVVRATNSTANWTITGNRLDKPIMYDDSGEFDLVKINVKAETVGTAVTESGNDWKPGALANGTYIADGDPALLPVAKIGDTYYWTLAAAAAAATDGKTITLISDVADAGNVSLKAGVTLDGDGHKVTGNSAVYINKAGGTVQNVVFEDIHNAANNLSAVYASGLKGTATITGCTFDNCDWDAIQATPVAGAVLTITGNVFDTDNTDGVQQQRYVHIQSAANVDFTATVTGNVMKGDTKQGALEAYFFADEEKIDVRHNYIEDMADVCILDGTGALRNDKVFPAYKDAGKTEFYQPVAMIATSAYSADYYPTVAAALIGAKSGDTIQILAGTWGADAIGQLDEPGQYTNANIVRYKSLTIQPAEGAKVTFTSTLSLGYDDSSTANATMTVKDLTFDGASLKIANYVQTTVEGCTFVNGANSAANGTLTIIDSCCTSHKTADEYPVSQVTVTGCSIDGSAAGSPGIRIRNSGNVTITGNVIKNTAHNGILFESNGSVDNTPVKTVLITDNAITEWNFGNVADGGRAMRLDFGTLAADSAVTIENNVFRKAVTGLDTPDFMKITGARAATVSLEGNDWNNELRSTVSGNSDYYTVDTATPVALAAVVTTKKEPVAQIGETKYETLQAAFDAAKTGDTVTLLSDITLTEQVNITKALDGLTLDGNGKTIICDTTDDPLKSGGGSALYFGNANDHLYCTGIKIKDLTMTGTARFAIFLCGGTTTEFTNVKISGKYYIAVNLYGTHGATMTNCDISNSTEGTDKYISAIWSNVASANPLTLNNSKVDVIAINAYTTTNELEPKIFVMDGSEVGEIHTFDDGSVSGNKKLCVSTSSTGTYVVKEYDASTQTWVDIRVAAIGAVGYATLADAIAAAKDGETVKLLTDVNGDGIAIAPNTFKTGLTVDFGNHTYTVGGLLVGSSGTASNGFQLNAGNKITFKNGVIVGATATAGAGTDWKGAPAILIQNYCDLTLEQMTVKGGDETCYTLSNNNGEIVIDGSTIVAGTGTKLGPFAFDVCRYSSYPSVHVTVKGASVIEGDVEISGTIGDNQSRQLDIEGGTFKGAFNVVDQPANIAISGGTFSDAVLPEYCAAGFIPTANGDGTYGVEKVAHVVAVTLGGEKKAMPFSVTWLAANIGADESSWTTAALEEKAANGLAKWQCYLFGLDPNKKDEKVVATAGQGTDKAIPLAVANADASASPLVTGGYVKVAYVLMGSNDGTVWTQVTTSDKRDGLAIPLTGTTYKFYRVDVTVTSAEGN